MSNILKYQIVMFIVMTIVGICFNAMNALAFSISHLYFSLENDWCGNKSHISTVFCI